MRTRVIVAMCMAIGIAGCGDDDPVTPNPGPNTVTMGEASFSPTSITIDQNESVTWTNPSGQVHNVTFADEDAPADIGDHSSGSNSRTFANTGTFSYVCTNHEGMAGTVVVQ